MVALDGVRGVAILLVLVLHFTAYGGTPAQDGLMGAVHRASMAGWIGVDLFFVLSGYLITGILLDSKEDAGYFRTFYIRRTLRIFPLYFGTLAALLVVAPAFWPRNDDLSALQEDGPWYATYLFNVHVAQDGWPEFPALAHFWSLAVEEQFYLLWPLVVLLLGYRPLLALCAGLAGVAIVVRAALHITGSSTAAFVLLPARADALAAGAALAVLVRTGVGRPQLRRWAAVALGGSVAGLVAIAVRRSGLPAEDGLVGVAGYSLLAAGFGGGLALVVSAPEHSRVRRVLSSRSLVVLGQYSYGLYVVHHPLLFFKPSSWSYDELPQLLGTSLFGWVAFCTAAGAVCLGLAMLSWHLLEQPFLRLKRRVPYAAGGIG